MANGLVQMKALLMATVSGSRGILHTDIHDNADHAARYPLVSEADAAILERNGYAERFDGTVPKDKNAADEDGDGDVTIGEYAAREVETNVDAENSVDATTGLATRDTTAFEAPVEELSAASGRTLTVDDGIAEAGAEETAPAGRRGRTAAKPAAAE